MLVQAYNHRNGVDETGGFEANLGYLSPSQDKNKTKQRGSYTWKYPKSPLVINGHKKIQNWTWNKINK